MNKPFLCIALLLLMGCRMHGSGKAHAYKKIRAGGISLSYERGDFESDSVEFLPAYAETERGTDLGATAPAHTSIDLEGKRPLSVSNPDSRYFFASSNSIIFIPLEDRTSKNFAEDYPDVTETVAALKQIFSSRPLTFDRLQSDIPEWDWTLDQSHLFLGRIRYLDFRGMTGIAYPTQYTQDASDPVNNDELSYVFEGITRNGKYYVTAHFSAAHPSLPENMDDTGGIPEKYRGNYLSAYTDSVAKALNGFPDDSFRPSLAHLNEVLKSISIR